MFNNVDSHIFFLISEFLNSKSNDEFIKNLDKIIEVCDTESTVDVHVFTKENDILSLIDTAKYLVKARTSNCIGMYFEVLANIKKICENMKTLNKF